MWANVKQKEFHCIFACCIVLLLLSLFSNGRFNPCFYCHKFFYGFYGLAGSMNTKHQIKVQKLLPQALWVQNHCDGSTMKKNNNHNGNGSALHWWRRCSCVLIGQTDSITTNPDLQHSPVSPVWCNVIAVTTSVKLRDGVGWDILLSWTTSRRSPCRRVGLF